jgi:hypothetical protein
MNKKGNIANLIAAHRGNRNATKSGVYSERARSEKEEALVESLRSRPVGAVLSEMMMHDLCSLRTLGDLLGADVAQYGVTNRRGESRRQVGQWSSVLRQAQQLRSAIQLELERRWTQAPDIGEEADVVGYEAHSERYSELRAIALGERPDASVAAQIRAIKSLFEMRPPRAPNPAEALSDEELQAAVLASRYERATSGSHGTAEPTEHEPSDHERCRDVLHKIASGRRIDARATDRIAAIELLDKLSPPAVHFIRDEIAQMTPDEVDATARELEAWFETFEAENPDLADDLRGRVS